MSATFAGHDRRAWPALLPVGFALAVTLYIALRYGFRWAEQDTTQIVASIRSTMAEQTIAPSAAYPHGYAYQALSATLGWVTGLDAATLQVALMPFLTLGLALAAFVAFRALTGSAMLGGLSALLLLIQPDFLFVIERGSHEKLTHTLVLMLLFLLVATLVRRPGPVAALALIATFYLGAWALITTNSFFASSFIASLALALAGGLLVAWLGRSGAGESDATRRLVYTVLSCFGLLFAFIVYVYRPADYNFGVLQNVLQQLAVLLLSFEPQTNPYAAITGPRGAAWVAPWVYPVLTAFNWTVIAAAAATWGWLGRRFLRDGVRADERHLLLLWLLAAAFAIEVLASVLADLSGSLIGSNLQLRLFPLFMLPGIPLALVGASALLGRIPRVWYPSIAAAGAGLLLFFAVVGVLKATNDPLVSNKWIFFTRSEERAVAWTSDRLEQQEVWAGFDERLPAMRSIYQVGGGESRTRLVVGSGQSAPYTVMSDVIARRSVRLGLPPPDVTVRDRVYDNGGAQVFHRVPVTPYQP